jgi:hypothetical protein
MWTSLQERLVEKTENSCHNVHLAGKRLRSGSYRWLMGVTELVGTFSQRVDKKMHTGS